MIRFLYILLALMLFGAAPAWSQAASPPAGGAYGVSLVAPSGPQRTERIEAELVSMNAWAVPGSTAVVAVRQKIQPGWHTYWRNPGDSGGATTLDWSLPVGVTAGEIVWPLPERLSLMSLAMFGYSDVVYLPVAIQIPSDIRPGTVLPLRVTALFMVCSDEICVPDEMELALTLPVREGSPPLTAVHGALIQQGLETAPRPAAIEARAEIQNGVLVLTAVGGPLEGRDPGPVHFYPFEGGRIDHAAAQTGSWGPRGLTMNLTPGGATRNGVNAPVAGVLSTALGDFEISATPGAPLEGATGSGAIVAQTNSSAVDLSVMGFLQAALFALLGGLILNLMPCVFPILAMKAASLTASAHDPKEARRDGLMFLAGVLVTFVLLAGLLLALRAAGQAAGWGFQLQSPGMTAALALLMLAVGLNLSGVFNVGAGLQAAGSGKLSRLPGGTGAFFTGVLAVVVAAPCTAPFMAFALGAALVMPWPLALLVFVMLGLGLALPYVLVSFSPRLLARLPRPGPWMERLKGLLAFPMYGTALWLAWVFSRQTGAEALALLFAAGLLIALGLWLAGVNQTARSEGRRAILSAVAAALALVAGVALTGAAATLPVQTATGGETQSGSGPVSAPWTPEAVQAALSEGRPVLVNFTADWCVTCKINERTSLSSGRVREAIEASNTLYLVGDWTLRDAAIAAELERHGRSGVPLYLLYTPGQPQPRILPQLLTEGLVVEALEGATR